MGSNPTPSATLTAAPARSEAGLHAWGTVMIFVIVFLMVVKWESEVLPSDDDEACLAARRLGRFRPSSGPEPWTRAE